MDSFFSLFDPSDGHKKKRSPENERAEGGGKGRRRGRRQGKSESLSEECSFLCAPELSGEVLVTDGSYMESHMRDDKAESEKKPRRRNSGRKNRRKKNKVSPSKDLIANNAWTENDAISDTDTTWNNQTDKPKICDDNVGKNVNDLKTDYKKSKTKSIEQFIGDADIGSYEEREMHSVAESLDKVKIQDDLFLAGDFNESDLESDFFYQSDEEVEFDESASSDSDSSSSCGRLPPEPRFGNVEYKLQLVAPGERRFQHLVTQLKWRLVSGGGRCVYVVGVRDCGRVRGLRAPALGASLRTLARMARHIGASPTHLTLRKVARDRALAEMYIRKLADTQQSVELRVAVMGANEAGKSTLIGVLTQGELDNGRGSARLNMFRHVHEVRSGRTSSLSHEILGFDAQGNVVNYGCSELMTAERIGERSAKLVSFLDLAGHSKYQRTTLHGLTGYSPHYAMLVISATAGITRITEEHIGLLLALDLPFLTVVTKTELAPVAGILGRLAALLAPANKRPVLITDENASEYIAPHKIIDGIDTEQDEHDNVLVFSVSCVSGAGLRALHLALHTLAPPDTAPPQEPCEFQIDEIFRVGGSEGPVVGGLLAAGGLREGDQVLLGPLETGEFTPITVKSIYRNRVPHGCVRAGQSASLGLAPTRAQLRPGMVLLSADTREPSPAMMPPLIPAESTLARRRNKNLLQQLETAETCLRKSGDGAGNEFREDDYTSDSYKERLERSAGSPLDKVINTGDRERGERGEENTGPRGTLYFQASVQVLRHVSRLRAGFQCVVHVANVRQTARIEGILSHGGVLRAGETASVVFRFLRCPEYVRPGRRLLFTAGLGTRAIGRVTQVFPYVP